jgi:hypothetical protein
MAFSTASGLAADPWTWPRAVPIDYPPGTPHMRTTHRQIRRWHLAALPVGAYRPNPDTQIGSDVAGGPPVGMRVRSRRHSLIVSK